MPHHDAFAPPRTKPLRVSLSPPQRHSGPCAYQQRGAAQDSAPIGPSRCRHWQMMHRTALHCTVPLRCKHAKQAAARPPFLISPSPLRVFSFAAGCQNARCQKLHRPHRTAPAPHRTAPAAPNGIPSSPSFPPLSSLSLSFQPLHLASPPALAPIPAPSPVWLRSRCGAGYQQTFFFFARPRFFFSWRRGEWVVGVGCCVGEVGYSVCRAVLDAYRVRIRDDAHDGAGCGAAR